MKFDYTIKTPTQKQVIDELIKMGGLGLITETDTARIYDFGSNGILLIPKRGYKRQWNEL